MRNVTLTSALVGVAVGGGVGAFVLKGSRPADVLWMAALGGGAGLVYSIFQERRAEAHVGAIAPKPGPPPPPAPGECPYDQMWDPVLQACTPILPWPIQR